MRSKEIGWTIAIMDTLSCTLWVSCLQTLLTHTGEMTSFDKTDQASTSPASLCIFEFILFRIGMRHGCMLVWGSSISLLWQQSIAAAIHQLSHKTVSINGT